MKKRGQFYLIAAIIIIAIILGFVAVQNFTKKKSTGIVHDLGQELGFEGGEVLEFGTFSNDDASQFVEDFVTEYSAYADEEGRDIYFVYGDETLITVATMEELVVGTISIDIGGEVTIGDDVYIEVSQPGGDIVTVVLGSHEYEFDLKPGENFYFIISQDIEGETHIVQG